MKLFPGQVERLVFTLDQAKSLASPVRSAVFWAFSSTSPMSVSEVAKGLKKSAQTVHYHVNALVKEGLLIGVDERKRHARTETLYVRAGYLCVDQGKNANQEYHEVRRRSFALTANNLVRERDLFYKAGYQNADVFNWTYFRWVATRFTPEQLDEIRDRLNAIIAEVSARPEPSPEEGKRLRLFFLVQPTQIELNEWLAESASDDDGQTEA